MDDHDNNDGLVALTKINAHEIICSERYANLNSAISVTNNSISDLKKLAFGVLLSVVGILVSALGVVLWQIVQLKTNG